MFLLQRMTDHSSCGQTVNWFSVLTVNSILHEDVVVRTVFHYDCLLWDSLMFK